MYEIIVYKFLNFSSANFWGKFSRNLSQSKHCGFISWLKKRKNFCARQANPNSMNHKICLTIKQLEPAPASTSSFPPPSERKEM